MEETRELTIQRELTPSILDMFMRLDQAAYKSRRFNVTEGETAIKILFCFENGLPLSTANTGLYVVKGKLQVEGNVIASQFRQHPDYDFRIKDLSETGCVIEVLRRNGSDEMEIIGEAAFLEEHAQRANLLGKDNWQHYPDDMYFNKALARAYRRYAPDLFSQTVYVPGELTDGETVKGDWEVVPAQESTKPAAPAPAAVNLDDLVQEHGAEAVLEANNGIVPASDEEIQAVAERLATS